ncbi:hypothetical protein [Spirosoma linguale]|uniref:Uncharacterized protein n=1 Tax=Spirosoma linguale (strain ATCC 33905 / DSM 74 / LMG 10896 / Claus 1) TaxID=504472 RepID=D2QLJ6_SPILD|nr:hypothetical protein Slin_4304 [Spirosoma linguale DSM 74]
MSGSYPQAGWVSLLRNAWVTLSGIHNKGKYARKNYTRNPGDVEEISIVPDNAKVYILATDWCPGKLTWYDDSGSPVTNFQIGVFTKPPTTVYQYQCVIDAKTTCSGTYSFATNGASGARIAATTSLGATGTSDAPTASVGTESPCDQVALSTAAGTLFSSLLCQSMNLMRDDNGQFSQQKILDYLALLKSQVTSYLPDLTLPADLNAVVSALLAGDCQKAGQLLDAANGQKTINIDLFNNTINSQYGSLQSSITSNYKDECIQEPAPVLAAEDSQPGGRLAAQVIDPNRYFIAPDGRAVRLPVGATPRFFTFSGQWGLPPVGTLQGFVTVEGKTYFAEITKSPQKFLGYRLATNPMKCPAERYDANLYVNVAAGKTAPAYYFAPIDKTSECGYTWNEGTYAFQRVTDGLVSINPPIPGNWQNQTLLKDCPKTGDYIVVGQVNYYHNTGGLSDDEKKQLGSLLEEINGKLGGIINGKGSVTVVDPKDLDGKEDALKREEQQKTTTEVAKLRYGNKYVLIFFSGGKLTPCQQTFVEEHVKAFQQSTFYRLAYDDLDGWVTNTFYQQSLESQKYTTESIRNGNDIPTYPASPSSEFRQLLLSTGAFYYYAALSVPSCLVDESNYYLSVQNPDGSVSSKPVGPENCGKAFAAGAIHSLIEDADVVTMFIGLSEIIKATLSGSLKTWMEYPGKLQAFQKKMEANPEAITPEDLATILPPSIQNEQKAMDQVTNLAQFLYQNYYTDANCWKSGELVAQVLPIVASAGALAAAKIAPLIGKTAGRLGRLAQALGSERLAQRLLNNSVEYIEVSANATKKVEQAILKDADGAIENIYEEVEDATTHQRQSVKICGACLAASTPLYGTTQTLHDAQPQQPIQTLEADGSLGWRKVVGKLRRRVSEYVSLWVKGERVDASVDHEFKTGQGWLSAGALRKGVMLVSLATSSLLPVDSVALVHKPLEVEGLSVGTAQGYGVGKWGLLTAGSRKCFLGFSQAHYEAIERTLANSADQTQFYNDISKFNADDFKALLATADDAEQVARNWQLLDGSPYIRQSSENLTNFQAALTRRPSDLTVEQIAAAVNDSDSKATLLENLKDAADETEYKQLLAGSRPFDVKFAGFSTAPDNLAIDAIPNASLKGEIRYLEDLRKNTPDARIRGDISEQLGEKAADAYAQSKGWGTQLCAECAGLQGEFDRVYLASDGTIRVIEAKGGTSPLGGRKTVNGLYVQQGTREYFDSIVNKMKSSSNPEVRRTAATIENTPSSKIEYWLVRQDFNPDNSLKSIWANKFF